MPAELPPDENPPMFVVDTLRDGIVVSRIRVYDTPSGFLQTFQGDTPGAALASELLPSILDARIAKGNGAFVDLFLQVAMLVGVTSSRHLNEILHSLSHATSLPQSGHWTLIQCQFLRKYWVLLDSLVEKTHGHKNVDELLAATPRPIENVLLDFVLQNVAKANPQNDPIAKAFLALFTALQDMASIKTKEDAEKMITFLDMLPDSENRRMALTSTQRLLENWEMMEELR